MLANGPGIDVDSMEPGVGSGFSQPVMELIQQRFSSRSYQSRPISAEARGYLLDFLATLDTGPLGTPARFTLSAAAEQERDALRSLGTYGFIKNPTGFIIGVVRRDIKDLEDFGYLMERAVLVATGLGLSTCWLGGSFRRSSFAKKIDVQTHEVLPAVISAGYSTSPDGVRIAPRALAALPAGPLPASLDGRSAAPGRFQRRAAAVSEPTHGDRGRHSPSTLSLRCSISKVDIGECSVEGIYEALHADLRLIGRASLAVALPFTANDHFDSA